jgi:hypothetical protein
MLNISEICLTISSLTKLYLFVYCPKNQSELPGKKPNLFKLKQKKNIRIVFKLKKLIDNYKFD